MLRTDELVIDNFAGGGGTSLGLQWFFRQPVDVAINHDEDACAAYKANHPLTRVLCQNIWQADPREVAEGRPIGLAWFSPDCTHHSKAKGGQPLQRNKRDLAWVVVHWAKLVQPRVLMLENVEEFADWGPLCMETNKPIVELKGQTFKRWLRALRSHGYRLEHRELRACDYGTPTIRKRLFVIARRDGGPICWPQPTHGPGLEPYRSAAECIDWERPCPSIFMNREEAQAYYEATGIRIRRPLAANTMARIARGVDRFVLQSQEPFIIPVTHQGDSRVHATSEPLRTVTTAKRGELALAAPCLVPRYGEREGQAPRCATVERPMPTVVPTSNQGSLVAAHMTKFHQGSIGFDPRQPMCTVTANAHGKRPGAALPIGIAAAHLCRHFGNSIGQPPSAPAPTVMPGGGGKTAIVAAWMAQHNSGMVGHPMGNPVSTIVEKGCTQGLAAVHLSHHFTSNTRGGNGDLKVPHKTVLTGGHHSLVAAFLAEYYRDGGQHQGPRPPLNTIPTKDKFALVTVVLDGITYVITDIGMRMLAPRELFRAQGFPEEWVIDPTVNGRTLTKEAQIRNCGNAVPPQWPKALAAANFGDEASRSIAS